MLKYSLGLDISSKDIHCCLSIIDLQQKVSVKSTRKISNSLTGFADLLQWLQKNRKHTDLPITTTMEATGVYYEHCALFLFKNGLDVAVVLPNKAKKYIQAIGLKSKNDKIDAMGLARMGAEQSLELWKPMDEFFYQLRALTRQHQSLQELKTNIGNQLHAEGKGMYINLSVIDQLKILIQTINTQIDEIEGKIKIHVHSDEEVHRKIENICTIKGVGLHTVATVLAETNGFVLFKNAGQLVSYAGYDVVQKESGIHVGTTRISKKGNSHIRRALHLLAFNVVRYGTEPFTSLFNRTLERHRRKMKSYVAVQKKILVFIYAIWKKDEAFDPDYIYPSKEQKPELPLDSSALAEVVGIK